MTAERNPPPKGDKYYNRVAKNYNRKRLRQDWWHVEQREMYDLLSGLPRGLKVVDIPFGTGRFVPYYLEFGYEVHGLDISSHMLDAAREALGDDFYKCRPITGSANSTPFGDGEFDLVVSTRFLSNIVTYPVSLEALAEFSRITSRYAIVQLGHNTEGDRAPDADETMNHSHSEAAIDGLLSDVGLKVLDRRTVLTNPDAHEVMDHILCEKTAS